VVAVVSHSESLFVHGAMLILRFRRVSFGMRNERFHRDEPVMRIYAAHGSLTKPFSEQAILHSIASVSELQQQADRYH
jgi:tRNA(Arg) A34 adenosine deaminase TadA